MALLQTSTPALIVTLDELRNHCQVNLGIDYHDEDDLLQLYGNAAQDYFARVCNISIGETTYTYTRDCFPHCFYLPRGPLIEITSFQYLAPDDTWTDFTDYSVADSIARARITTDNPPSVSTTRPNVSIEFSAGYTSDNIPPLLKRGVLALARHYYRNRGEQGDESSIAFGLDTIRDLYRIPNV